MSATSGETPTDPGRRSPYDRLYRSTSPAGRPTSSDPAPYDPAAHSEDGPDGSYGWLFRNDEQSGPHAPVGAPAGPVTPAAPPPPPPPPAGWTDPTGPAAPTGPAPVSPQRRRSRGPLIAVAVALAALAAGVVVGLEVSGRRSAQGPSAPGASSPANPATSGSSSSGTATGSPGAVVPSAAVVACQAADATDDAGNPVAYTPEQMFDGDLATAWRCDGRGTGQQIRFDFSGSTRITSLGLVNGYAKVDPASGARRYPEYRRITRVTWTFADGTAIQQRLSGNSEALQTIRIPYQEADEVTLRIDAVSKPGSKAKTRDAVLISEVAFGS